VCHQALQIGLVFDRPWWTQNDIFHFKGLDILRRVLFMLPFFLGLLAILIPSERAATSFQLLEIYSLIQHKDASPCERLIGMAPVSALDDGGSIFSILRLAMRLPGTSHGIRTVSQSVVKAVIVLGPFETWTARMEHFLAKRGLWNGRNVLVLWESTIRYTQQDIFGGRG
jgi:hypothetical protein